jgi:SAM-dependent methyltransferase
MGCSTHINVRNNAPPPGEFLTERNMAEPIDERSESVGSPPSAPARQQGGSNVETAVREFYDKYGWTKGGEDELYRQFRAPYWPYHEQTVARTLECFTGRTGSLLFVGGGDLPQSHVDLASRFASVSCIDISEAALNITQNKLPDATRVLGSICEAPLTSDTYDAVFAAHVIYHIDRNQQERAVREIIRVTKPGGRVVILYNNPHSPLRFAAAAVRQIGRRLAPSRPTVQTTGRPAPLYFSPYPLSWWKRFRDTCSLTMLPWDIIGSGDEKSLIRTDGMARAFYGAASWAETHVPSACVYLWQYPIVILDKK